MFRMHHHLLRCTITQCQSKKIKTHQPLLDGLQWYGNTCENRIAGSDNFLLWKLRNAAYLVRPDLSLLSSVKWIYKISISSYITDIDIDIDIKLHYTVGFSLEEYPPSSDPRERRTGAKQPGCGSGPRGRTNIPHLRHRERERERP